MQTQWFLSFLARAFAPNLYALIQSFSSWPLLLSQWLPNQATWKTGHLKLTSRLRATSHTIKRPKGPKSDGSIGQCPLPLTIWSPVRKLLPSCPNSRHCLGIHVTLTKETGAAPPPPHTWMAPLLEDMLHYGRTGLTKAVMMGPGRVVLFYRRWSMGEGLSLVEVRDTTFTLTGAGIWVGKPAYLATDPLTRGKRARATMLKSVEHEPFIFHHPGDSHQKDHPRDARFDHQPSPHRLQRGQDHDQWRRDQMLIPHQPPSPSLDHSFESHKFSVDCLISIITVRQVGRLPASPTWQMT